MTRKRNWLALGALLTAIVGGTIWAADQKKATQRPDAQCEIVMDTECHSAAAKKCCDEKCSTKDDAKACCEGKCCAAEKGKSCCADGKCCGCCEKAKSPQVVTVPVPAGSAVQVTVAPSAGLTYEMPFAPPPPYVSAPCMPPLGCGSAWGNPVPPPAPLPPPPVAQFTPASQPTMQYIATPGMPVQGCGTAPLAPPAPPVQTVPVSPYVAEPTPALPQPSSPPMVAPRTFSSWRLRVQVKNDHPCLLMQWDGNGDTRAFCDEMALQVGPEPLKVSVANKQVSVSGNFLKGSADTISRNTADGNLLLEGHVKMHYGREGKKVEVAADQVVVGIADGRVEVRGLGHIVSPTLPAPQEIRPTSTTAPQCPLCPTSKDDRTQLFNFWMGFMQ
jgi:hypothetical protein